MFSLLVPWKGLSNTLNSSQKSIKCEHVCLRCRTQKELEFCSLWICCYLQATNSLQGKEVSLFAVHENGHRMTCQKRDAGILEPPCNTNIYLNISFSTSKCNFQFRVINDRTAESDLSVRKNKYDSLPCCCFSTLIKILLIPSEAKNYFPYPAYYVWHIALWD